MVLRVALMLLLFNCVLTQNVPNRIEETETREGRRSLASSYYTVGFKSSHKRDVGGPVVLSEGGAIEPQKPALVSPSVKKQKPDTPAASGVPKPEKKTEQLTPEVSDIAVNLNSTKPLVKNNTNTNSNGTTTKGTVKELDLKNPGVLKRGFIVFGGFALLGVAYYVFFKWKRTTNDASNNSNIEGNQFRYGVLQSEEQHDSNMELSRIPLWNKSMNSDDDEDEDVEIFGLESNTKSLSYVNLQTNDVEFDLASDKTDDMVIERDNLLLDIEDANSEALINWSSNDK